MMEVGGAYMPSPKKQCPRRPPAPRRALILPALLLVFVTAFAPGQDRADNPTLPPQRFDEALGAFAGFVGGTGLSYQRWHDGLGWQVAGGGYYLPQGNGEYALGLEGQWRIHDATLSERVHSRLYGVLGIGHYATINPGLFEGRIHAGIGLGVETILFDHFSFPVELLYRGTFIVNTLAPGQAGLAPAAGFRFRY